MATVVAILYSLWYPEMSSALAVEWHEYLDDGRPAIAIVRAALLTRAVPLVVVSVLPAVVFAPEAAGELLGALGAVGKPGSLYVRSKRHSSASTRSLSSSLPPLSVQARRVFRWWRRLSSPP